jgi:hypothetical protein
MTREPKFISEDDLDSFEVWLKYQRVTPANPDELAEWRASFEEAKASKSAKVSLMKLESRPMAPGEYRYGVAVRDEDSNLWLTLWVRRSPRPEYFIMIPRGDRGWNPHTSYHVDGRLHSKSFRHIIGRVQKRQRLDGTFRGTEHLGGFGGHGPKSVGAVCDPKSFSGILEVPPGILGPRDGTVVVDLVEPGREPEVPWANLVRQQTFRDADPWVVIRVAKS